MSLLPVDRSTRLGNESSQIAQTCRRQSYELFSSGDTAGALACQEDGLAELCNPRYHRDEAKLEQIKIIHDMETLGDHRNHQRAQQLADELITRPTATKPLEPGFESTETADQRWQRNRQHANEELKLFCYVGKWDEVKKKYQEEVPDLNPTFYEVDPDNPLDIFGNLKALLKLGECVEEAARTLTNGPNDPQRRETALKHQMIALRCYNWGCYLSNLFHKHFDKPTALFTIMDHDYCSALFLSAARICVTFSDLAGVDKPSKIEATPRLDGDDWKRQALIFLERGKARALLDSIVRNRHEALGKPDHTDEQHKTTYLWDSMSRTLSASSARRRRSPSQSDQDTTSAQSSPSSSFGTDHVTSSPLAISAKEPFPSIHKNLKTAWAWQKAILSVMGYDQDSPPTSINGHKINRMLLRIPDDTVIIEFGLVSDGPTKGLLSVAATRAAGKEKLDVTWQKVDPEELRTYITIIRWTMNFKSQEKADKKKDIVDLLIEHGKIASEADMFDKFELAKKSLSRRLLKPFGNMIRNKEKILIVPSSNLAHIPWSMLPMNPDDPADTRLYVDHHTIAMIPSLSIWDKLVSKTLKSKPEVSPKVMVMTNAPRKPNPPGGFRDIPYSRIEALYISRSLDEWPTVADELEKGDFNDRAHGSSILHISAHGDFDNDFPLNSRIHLLNEPLTVNDFKNVQMSASLVIFSACLSGLSSSSDSGSSFSFAHAILNSGARAFIGTLWPVNDVATLLIMMMFYERLRAGHSPSSSLRGAKLTMRNFQEQDLTRLASELQKLEEGHNGRTSEFVTNIKYWRKQLDPRERSSKHGYIKFREEQYWAPFVLTGHGDHAIYQSDEVKRRAVEALGNDAKRLMPERSSVPGAEREELLFDIEEYR
jgi:CHAT domain-containing protein